MPIFDQGYQNWHGELAPRALRWLAITRQGVRTQFRNRRTKYLVIAAWTPALLLVTFLALWGLLEQKSDFINSFAFVFEFLPPEVREGPKAFRTSIWTLAFAVFLMLEVSLSLLLTLIVGPDLISQDLRFSALPLYLSRPLRRFDYFLGKLGVIGTYVGLVTVAPVVVAYVVGVAFSLDVSVIRDTWQLLLAATAYGALVAIVCGLMMLAFSSLSRNSRVVASLWVGLWIVSGMVAGAVIQATGGRLSQPTAASQKWLVLSFSANLDNLRTAMLDTESALRQLGDAYNRMFEMRQRVMEMARSGRGRGLLGGLLGRRRGSDEGEGSESDPVLRGLETNGVVASSAAAPETPPLFEALRLRFPWTWSAGVLSALCGISLCVLTTRVKSLDRLR